VSIFCNFRIKKIQHKKATGNISVAFFVMAALEMAVKDLIKKNLR